jgi:hypothetical protein
VPLGQALRQAGAADHEDVEKGQSDEVAPAYEKEKRKKKKKKKEKRKTWIQCDWKLFFL